MSPTLTETSRAWWLVGNDAHVYDPALFLSLPVAHTGWDFNRPLVLPEAITASKPAWTLWVEATHSPAPPDAAALISELRDRTDLTWEECARLFGVSRRTAHYWAKGANAMTAAHQRRLSQILEIVRDFDASATQMQAALRSSVGGRSIIEIIAMGASPALIRDHLASQLGSGRTRRAEPWQPLELLPEQPRDPRHVPARSLLRSDAAPVFDPEDPTSR
jgi:DNA-binding transcriptional regulator YiaG